jgi:hypothetical protein
MALKLQQVRFYPRHESSLPLYIDCTNLFNLFGYFEMGSVPFSAHHEAVSIGQVHIILWMLHLELLGRKIAVKNEASREFPSV